MILRGSAEALMRTHTTKDVRIVESTYRWEIARRALSERPCTIVRLEDSSSCRGLQCLFMTYNVYIISYVFFQAFAFCPTLAGAISQRPTALLVHQRLVDPTSTRCIGGSCSKLETGELQLDNVQ